MFAEITESDLLWKGIIVCTAVLGLVLQVIQLSSRNKSQRRLIEPSPLVVSPAAEHPSRKEFEAHVENTRKTTDDIFARLGGMERGMRREFGDQTEGLRQKVDHIASDMAAVKTEAEIHTRQLEAVQADIKQLIATKEDRT